MKATFTPPRALDNYLKAIEQAGKDVDQSAQKAVEAGRDEAVAMYQDGRVPKDTGDLEDFLTKKTEPVREGNVVKSEVGLPTRREAARRGYSPAQAAEISRYGAVQNYGKANMPAQSFIDKTVTGSGKSRINKAMQQSLEEDGVL